MMISKRAGRRAAIAFAAALVLVTGAISLSPATAESGLSPLELAQVQRANCQVLLAHATSAAQQTRANQCIVDQGAVIAALSPSASPSATLSPSPSPSPTVQPSPSVSPTATTAPPPTPPASPTPSPSGPVKGCVTAPGKCGYPDALSTGPTAPLAVSTRTQYTVAGETIVNTEVRGCVQVRAANVTFRNVYFNAAGCFWGVQSLSSGLSIVDSEITCGGANGTGIGSSGFSLLRVDIHNCENGLDVGSTASMVDSWIHDMETGGGAHTDGVQIGEGSKNLVIRHNTIAMAAPGATSAIISWDEGGTQQQNVAIDGNLLSGGTYTLYCPRQGTSDTRVTNNRFGPFEYKYSDSCIGSHVSAWSGNVADATGTALAAE